MKIRNILASSVVAFSMFAAVSAANATIVNFAGPYPVSPAVGYNMGIVAKGQYGVVGATTLASPTSDFYSPDFSLPPIYNVKGVAFGLLPSMTKITFTYSYTATPSGVIAAELNGSGTYTPYTKGGNTYYGSAVTDTGYVPGGFGGSHDYEGFTQVGSNAATPSLPLLWSTANVTSPTGGTVTIQNNSGTLASFSSTFLAYVTSFAGTTGKLTYNVSAIPLPASLPLFGAVLAGMFGFARFNKQRKASAFAA